MDYHLELSRAREFGFPRFPTIIRTNVKIVFNSPILVEVSNWDLKGWCKGAWSTKITKDALQPTSNTVYPYASV